MATISFLPIGKKEPKEIYLRLSIDRKNVFKRKSSYTINSKDWSTSTKLPKPNDEDNKRLKNDLVTLREKIYTRLNDALTKKESINGEWLQEQINILTGKKVVTDLGLFVNYCQYYIDYLPNKVYKDSTKGAQPNTIAKYKALKQKLIDFETYTQKKVLISDINLSFSNQFQKYLKNVAKLSSNSIGKYITLIKSICNHAIENGFEVHKEYSQVLGWKTTKEVIITLNPNEITKIEQLKGLSEAMDNSRDWLVIGCYIGQRVSDLLSLTKASIKSTGDFDLIDIQQKKTNERVSIPVHPKVREILDKRNGDFPNPLSDQKFNSNIKKIAEKAEIDDPIKGVLFNKDSKQKVEGIYPKHKLISSHICRRSFATNNYGNYPTPLLLKITGHKTEKQFLDYIGKSDYDYAKQLAEYWQKEQQKKD